MKLPQNNNNISGISLLILAIYIVDSLLKVGSTKSYVKHLHFYNIHYYIPTVKQRLADEIYASEQKKAIPNVITTNLKGINGERLQKAMEKVEMKKQKRIKRRAEVVSFILMY